MLHGGVGCVLEGAGWNHGLHLFVVVEGDPGASLRLAFIAQLLRRAATLIVLLGHAGASPRLRRCL